MARDGGMTLAEADPVLAYLREFRASFDTFRALVETRLDRVEGRLAKIEERLDNVEIGLAALSKRLDNVETGLAALSKRLDNVEIGLAANNSRFDTIEARISLVTVHFDRKLNRLRKELVAHMEQLHLEIERRVGDLEGPARGNGGGSALTN